MRRFLFEIVDVVRTGQPDLIQALPQNLPSLNAAAVARQVIGMAMAARTAVVGRALVR